MARRVLSARRRAMEPRDDRPLLDRHDLDRLSDRRQHNRSTNSRRNVRSALLNAALYRAA